MIDELREVLWKQFGGVIEMLENAIRKCPENVWNSKSQFWYISYHTLFYLDYYLSDSGDNFHPPAPFSLSEFDPEGAMPDEVYGASTLLNYLEFCRYKCRNLIAGLNEETAAIRFINPYRNYSRIEIIIYNIRHVQHHVGQLNLILRQEADIGAGWVSTTKINL